ncbi:PD-(D/E)XK nuclease superfamily [Leptolyngbya phage Lbo-JY46]
MNSKSKLRTGQYTIDHEVQTITMLDSRFYEVEPGLFLPSVSTILNSYPKGFAFLEWLKKNGENADEIRDLAGEKGSIVHRLTEDFDNGLDVNLFDSDGTIRYRLEEWAMFERYVEFSKKFEPEIISTEQTLYSKEIGTAGTLDRRMNLLGRKLIIDIKTSNSIDNSYWLQLAAYAKMYEQMNPNDPIDGVAILWLKSNTKTEGRKGAIQGYKWQMVFPDKPLEHYWNLFLATQALWNEENAGMKPRFTSYSLTHKK